MNSPATKSSPALSRAVETASIAVEAQLVLVRRIGTTAADRVEARACTLAAAAVAAQNVPALRAIESDLRTLIVRLRAHAASN